MGATRLAAAVLTALLLTSSSAQPQDGPPPAEEADKKAVEKKIKEKMLLNCKKTGDCKPELLDKKKPKKPKPGGPAAAEFADAEDGPDLGSDAPQAPPAGEQAEAARQEAVGRRDRAMERAAGAAESLRQSLLEAEAEPASERRPPGGGRTPSGAADGPPSVQELALAERSGYAAAFRAHGLKVGAGPGGEVAIQRLDGAPASAPELARLGAFLRAEPEALRRRPDFFAAVTRERFSELKRDYAARPELRSTAFKHMALTEGGRDFQWAASCTPLSGDCNPVVDDRPYRKGQDVSPEDLTEVWESIAEEDEEEEDEEWGEYSEEDRRLAEAEDLAAASLARPLRRLPTLSSLLARLGGFSRRTGTAPAPSSDGPAPEPVGAAAASGSGSGEAASDEGARAERAQGGAVAASRRPGAPSAPLGPATAGRRTGLYVLAAAAAAAFIALGLRKRG